MISSLYRLFEKYPSISTDTRKISPNSLFFCLKGENFDGNRFAKQAIESGATHVISDDPANAQLSHVTIVDDVLKTLQQLALFHRQQLSIPVIGITGTNGKTTTKELITAILSKKYRTACTKGNLNNHIGVPLTLLSICPDDEIAVVEMGANHPGEICELCNLALPTASVITNIGKAHLEGFGSLENIFQTKTDLYRFVMKNEGTLFVNLDNPLFAPFSDYTNIAGYSQKRGQSVNGQVIRQNPFLELTLTIPNSQLLTLNSQLLTTQLTGCYNLYNILCAAAVGNYFGVSLNDIKDALENYKPDNNRSQIIQKGGVTLIADYYNANPTSMEAALRNLASLEAPKKFAVLGDMLELGDISQEEHTHIMKLSVDLDIPSFFIGNEFATCSVGGMDVFENVEEFNNQIDTSQFVNSTILVKGSRGIKLEQLRMVKQMSDEKK
ncbi:MAG: UDP-N-acetylmuramoyl-tripeptide--D-alanyl-D-alanine ligase [Bacteroidales bacterium]|jgi:UDP-N-acetylmuramoyl-tripeptide--D-alanyl-D-alanine ligase|nr:UDP-N-acetylmuramoyl-tripeptide--D-alanyl-D-alanine ligase [Bacteroidales bacterium]